MRTHDSRLAPPTAAPAAHCNTCCDMHSSQLGGSFGARQREAGQLRRAQCASPQFRPPTLSPSNPHLRSSHTSSHTHTDSHPPFKAFLAPETHTQMARSLAVFALLALAATARLRAHSAPGGGPQDDGQ